VILRRADDALGQPGPWPGFRARLLSLTVDTYGRWLPMGNKQAVGRLDDAGAGGAGLGDAAGQPKSAQPTPRPLGSPADPLTSR